MPDWIKSHAASQQFAILLFEGFSNHCLANTVEPLRAANTLSRKELYHWRFLTLDGAAVGSSSGLRVAPHDRLRGSSGDLLIVMPSYGFVRHGGWRTQAALRAASHRFCAVAGLDTGSWLLAEAGLLDGYRATIHWEELMRFAERFPEVATERARFVIDGSRITCSGAMAAFDMVMHMIRRNHGAALALEVAQLFMTSDSARSDAGTARAGGALVNRALALMQETLETPLTVAEIARRCGASQKRLENAMSTDLGASPRTIYRRLRLNLARKLASETELPVAEIAMRSGYDNASAMTRAFRTEFGTTPRMLRQSGIEML